MKKIILSTLVMGWVLSSVCYGNLPSPQEMAQFCAENPEAMPHYCNSLQQSVIPTDPVATTAQLTTDPATSYLAPAQDSLRAPNLLGLEYQPLSSADAKSYYMSKSLILENQIQNMQWQRQQQMLQHTLNGFKTSHDQFMKRETEANEQWRLQFAQIQQNFFKSFQVQQAAMFSPANQNQAINQDLAFKYQELLKKFDVRKSDDSENSEDREDPENKTEDSLSKDDIHETLLINTTEV